MTKNEVRTEPNGCKRCNMTNINYIKDSQKLEMTQKHIFNSYESQKNGHIRVVHMYFCTVLSPGNKVDFFFF